MNLKAVINGTFFSLVLTLSTFSAECWSNYQYIEKVALIPNGSGYKIKLTALSSDWLMNGCSEIDTAVVDFNSGYSKEFLSAILTAKASGTRIRIGCTSSCPAAYPTPVTLLQIEE
jgi:hypothetical protein